MRCESKKCQVQPPLSSAAAVVCPPEPLHHSARHLSKVFAPEYRAPLLSLIKPPQASNQKKRQGNPEDGPATNPVSLSAQIHHHNFTVHALYRFTSPKIYQMTPTMVHFKKREIFVGQICSRKLCCILSSNGLLHNWTPAYILKGGFRGCKTPQTI